MSTTKSRRLYYRAMSRVLTQTLTSKNLTVSKLASKTGLAVSTINSSLTGMTSTSWLTIVTMVRGLDLDLTALADAIDAEEKSMMPSTSKDKK